MVHDNFCQIFYVDHPHQTIKLCYIKPWPLGTVLFLQARLHHMRAGVFGAFGSPKIQQKKRNCKMSSDLQDSVDQLKTIAKWSSVICCDLVTYTNRSVDQLMLWIVQTAFPIQTPHQTVRLEVPMLVASKHHLHIFSIPLLDIRNNKPTLPKMNIVLENQWFRKWNFHLGWPMFKGKLLVSGECDPVNSWRCWLKIVPKFQEQKKNAAPLSLLILWGWDYWNAML